MPAVHDWDEDSALGRLWKTLAELAATRELSLSVDFVCDVAVERLAVTAACLVVSNRPGSATLRHASGALGDRAVEIEVTVGEGPVLESIDLASSLFVPDLDAPRGYRHWPVFAPLAVEAGVRACLVFPLTVGVVRAGVLALYHAEPGLPSTERLSEAMLFADLLLALLLTEQAGRQAGAAADEGFPLAGAAVHQATGIVAAQLDIDPDDAFARLRARAFADGRRLAELAADVVARRIRFDRNGDAG
ncbi:GAF and ANTAR domain-containing protein [Amycolatopsis sp. NPDC021455]|uniref:GAF and ANTAR domain-containing protein n=1 Tax=Amycolatopsis sp. NPDC021455 TaxID=3154901 RepID=UPI003406A159